MSVLHKVLRDAGLLVVGYNRPTGFHYWSEGLLPLFEEATLGPLPHEVGSLSECMWRLAGLSRK